MGRLWRGQAGDLTSPAFGRVGERGKRLVGIDSPTGRRCKSWFADKNEWQLMSPVRTEFEYLTGRHL